MNMDGQGSGPMMKAIQENNIDMNLAFGYAYTHFDVSTKYNKSKAEAIMKEYAASPTPITIWSTQPLPKPTHASRHT